MSTLRHHHYWRYSCNRLFVAVTIFVLRSPAPTELRIHSYRMPKFARARALAPPIRRQRWWHYPDSNYCALAPSVVPAAEIHSSLLGCRLGSLPILMTQPDDRVVELSGQMWSPRIARTVLRNMLHRYRAWNNSRRASLPPVW